MTQGHLDDFEARARNASYGSVMCAVMAAWLVVAPFLTGYAAVPEAFWNSLLFGLLVLISSVVRILAPMRRSALSWASALFGLWIAAAPFLLSFQAEDAAVWSMALAGFFIVLASVWSASETAGVR